MHEISKEELIYVAAAAAAGPIDESLLHETLKVVALGTCSCRSEGFHCAYDRSSISYSGTTIVVVLIIDSNTKNIKNTGPQFHMAAKTEHESTQVKIHFMSSIAANPQPPCVNESVLIHSKQSS